MTKQSLVPIQLPADPANPLEAATKQYVDAHAGGSTDVVWVGTSAPSDPNVELWYDTDETSAVAIDQATADTLYLNTTGDTATGLLLSANPTDPLGATTKQYVDAVDAKRLVPTTIGYSADGTWTKPANLVYVTVEVVGAGGGSGGCPLTGASQGSAGGAGGGGGYSRKRIMAANLGATETVTVGAGGAAGTTTTAGGTGETSSFGAHCSATGGAGGGFGVLRTGGWCVNGGNGGTGSSGDINVGGGSGESGIVQYFGTVARARGGTAAGGWGMPGDNAGATTGAAGATGKTYGGGAGGSFNCASQATAKAGGLGGGGLVLVTNWVWS